MQPKTIKPKEENDVIELTPLDMLSNLWECAKSKPLDYDQGRYREFCYNELKAYLTDK